MTYTLEAGWLKLAPKCRELSFPVAGELVLRTKTASVAPVSRRRIIRKSGAVLGGFACVTRAALGHQGRHAQLSALAGSVKGTLRSLPENGRRLLAGALAGKVRGRLAAAAWAGEKQSLHFASSYTTFKCKHCKHQYCGFKD